MNSTRSATATRHLRSRSLQDHDPRAVAGRRRSLAPLGAASRRLARRRPPRRCSTWRGSAPGSRVLDVAAGAGEQSLAAARRVGPDRARARHRHRAGAARARRAPTRAPPGWPTSRRASSTARRSTALPAATLRRRDLPRRADLLPRPAARAGRHAPRAASRAAASRRSSTRRPSATRSSRMPVGIIRAPRPAAAAAAGPAGPVLARRRRRARAALAQGRASRDVEVRERGVARATAVARPNACASSASRSARCTR